MEENNIVLRSKTTVARCMQELNLVARPKRRFSVTTDSQYDFAIAENLLDRNFDVEYINTCWVSYITCILVNNRWMYLTNFIDLTDRMVVGLKASIEKQKRRIA